MEVVISREGTLRMVYQEELDLTAIGSPRIERASRVEPDHRGEWWADLSPVNGPVMGPFAFRCEAVKAEVHYLVERLVLHFKIPTA